MLALSGKTEQCLQISQGQMDFVPAFDSDFTLDERLLPFVQLQTKDHRGNMVSLSTKENKRRYFQIKKNSYALDFWRNPDAEALLTHNKLSVAERWYLINEFNVSFGIYFSI